MLNIGPLEMLIVILIALVVVGPRRLPELGRTIGAALRELRKAQEEVRKNLQLEELDDVRREISDAQRGMREALLDPLLDPPKSGNGAAPGTAPVEPAAAPTQQPEPAARGEAAAPGAPDEPVPAPAAEAVATEPEPETE
ncbi:MAG: twin-arginine translocase TatA/TatE family subunit [Actinobacteria bacterium]|nr:twin-arginine translocase TatA/TatE family subunit [Actinomycetota bacterium]